MSKRTRKKIVYLIKLSKDYGGKKKGEDLEVTAGEFSRPESFGIPVESKKIDTIEVDVQEKAKSLDPTAKGPGADKTTQDKNTPPKGGSE